MKCEGLTKTDYGQRLIEEQYGAWEGQVENQYELKGKEQVTEEVGPQAGIAEGVKCKG